MFKKIIIPTLLALAFSANASALNYKGKFKKSTHKISGSWALVEVQGQQVINFGKKFKTESGNDLALVLSKKSVRALKKDPSLDAALKLATLKSHKGTQYYIVPANIDISEYESVLIHSTADNVTWGGFDIPSDKGLDDELTSSAFEEDSGSFGS